MKFNRKEIITENRAVRELADDDLDQVTGGVSWRITSLSAGDVFINSSDPDNGIVIMQDYSNVTDQSYIQCRIFTITSSGIYETMITISYNFGYIKHNYTYSPEYTGKVGF